MKTLSLFIFLTSTFPHIAFAQWIELNSGTTENLYSIDCIDSNICYAVGSNQTILKTVDGGNTWVTQNSPVGDDNLRSVDFPVADTGYTIGTGPPPQVFFKTTDGGIIWNSLIPPGGFTGYDPSLFFITTEIGYALYSDNSCSCGRIYKTTDGGVTWFERSVSTVTSFYSSIDFPVTDTGYAITSGVMVKTTDGNTWSNIYNAIDLNSIDFSSTDMGYAVGESGRVIKTTDGGDNWTSQISNVTSRLIDVHFPAKDTGYIVGWQGVIIKTIDGGNNWVIQNSPTNNTLNDVKFLNSALGYIVGDSGTILKTTNGGETGLNVEDNSSCEKNTTNVFPNPFSDFATLTINSPLAKGARGLSFTMYDLLGREVKSETIRNSDTFVIRRGNLPSGMYFYKLTDKRKVLATGKIVIQ